jgi:hypothetical protein
MNPLPTKPNRWRPITVFNLLVGLLFSLSTLAQPAFLKEGLVAYYPFDGNANDESGKNWNGLVGRTTIVSDRFGRTNAACYSDEVGSGVDIPLKMVGIYSSSFSFWFKTTSGGVLLGSKGLGPHLKLVVGSENSTGPGTTGVVYFGLQGRGFDNISVIQQTKNKGSADGYWHHVVGVMKSEGGVFSSSMFSIFIDGKIVTGNSLSDINPIALPFEVSNLSIASDLTWSTALHTGPAISKISFDDVRIYNRALSDTEVKALYDYESTPPDNSFITNGLVAHYPFDGNAKDASGNENNGVVTGATLTTDRFGVPDHCYLFNGVTDNILATVASIPTNAQDRTLVLWEKLSGSTTSTAFYVPAAWGLNNNNQAFGLLAWSVPKIWAVQFWGGGQDLNTTQSADNDWHQIACVLESNIAKFYYDGVLKASSLKITSTGFSQLFIGKGVEKTGTYFPGSIDDVRIYNRALSDTEVKALYKYEATPPIQSPVFVSQPVSKTVNSGDNIVLAVELQTAGTYNYQWQLNEQNIAGATASSLAVNNAVAGVYRYRVIVSNSAGTVISDTATLTVNTPPAPSIVTQPAPKAVQEGANVSFNVVATGLGSLVYQWQFNEQNLPGATSATLNLNGVKLNTTGRYRVLISSQYGVTISDTVTLTVNANPPPTIVTQPLSRTPAEGTQVSLTVTATGLGSLTYQWQINNQNIPGATSSTLVLSAVRPSVNGNYRVIVGNPYGTTISTEASVAVVVTDADSDGLSDYEELLLGTNANKADSDGDGLSDFAEVRTHGSNPLTTDTDGDGYSDGIEVARDGNPNNRSVTPTGALAVFPAVDVEFYTLNSVKYQLEVSTDMVSWSAQGGVVVGTGGSQNHLVRASKTTQFWRLKVVQ